MITLYGEIDAVIESSSNPSDCKPGCCECCSQLFQVSCLEFLYCCYGFNRKYGFLDELYAYGDLIFEEIKARTPNVIQLLDYADTHPTIAAMTISAEQLYLEAVHLKYPCPFLNLDTGQCTIYEYRPLVCRAHGIGYFDKDSLGDKYLPCAKNQAGVSLSKLVNLEKYAQSMVDFSKFTSSKHRVTIIEPALPLFYFCHKAHTGLTEYNTRLADIASCGEEQYANKLYARFHTTG